MTDQTPPADDAALDEGTVSRDSVQVRRSPRYGRFIILGAGLGAVATFIVTNLFPIDPSVGFGALFGYLLLFGVPIGAALGGLAAVIFDVVNSRRAKVMEAERITVDPLPEDVEGDVEDGVAGDRR